MPNRIRIADDGTIIRGQGNTESNAGVAPAGTQTPMFRDIENNSVNMAGDIALPQLWWQKSGTHWTITMLISSAISLIAFFYIAPLVFVPTNSKGFIEGIINFFMIISPYVILVSGILGQFYYNKYFVNKYDRGYTIKDYALSPFVSSGSVVTAGTAMFLLTLIASIVIGLFVIILGVALLISIFSGS